MKFVSTVIVILCGGKHLDHPDERSYMILQIEEMTALKDRFYIVDEEAYITLDFKFPLFSVLVIRLFDHLGSENGRVIFNSFAYKTPGDDKWVQPSFFSGKDFAINTEHLVADVKKKATQTTH